MTSENRYHIMVKTSTDLVSLKAMGIGTGDGPQPQPKLDITIQGEVTLGEFHRVFGPEQNINHMMCIETDDIDGYTIHVFLSDVLACEGQHHSHQDVLVNAMLKCQGMDELDHEEIARRARDYSELSPQAAAFLLSCAGGGMKPDELDSDEILNQALGNKFTLEDFLLPAEE